MRTFCVTNIKIKVTIKIITLRLYGKSAAERGGGGTNCFLTKFHNNYATTQLGQATRRPQRNNRKIMNFKWKRVNNNNTWEYQL